MKLHLKRFAAPKTWKIKVREKVWIVRPKPTGCSLRYTLPIVYIIRDILKLAKTRKEVRYMINSKQIYLNGKVIKDDKQGCSLFDVIYVQPYNRHYRIIMHKKKLDLLEIKESESKISIAKVVKKTVLPKRHAKKENANYIQINLSNGKNFLTNDNSIKTGCGVIFNFFDNKIVSVIPLEIKSLVYIEKGSHEGEIGTVVEMDEDECIVEIQGKRRRLKKSYLLPVGKEKSLITLTK
ncbi:MAG: S4 domain-containing protein [Candidatus Woesearchaeota archaeon]